MKNIQWVLIGLVVASLGVGFLIGSQVSGPSSSSTDYKTKAQEALHTLSSATKNKAREGLDTRHLTSEGLADYFAGGNFPLGEKTSSTTIKSKDGMVWEFTGDGRCEESWKNKDQNDCWVTLNMNTKAGKNDGLWVNISEPKNKIEIPLELIVNESWPNGYVAVCTPDVLPR